MPLQTGTMSARARAKRIKQGRNHGSGRTLAQADDSLKAFDDLTPELQAQVAEHGYGAADRTELGDGRDALLESGIQREEAQADSESLTQAYGETLKRGKGARRWADSVLRRAQDVLDEKEDGEAGSQAIEVALRIGSSSGADADLLREQLQALRSPLARLDVAAVTADRGGPAVLAAVDASIAELRTIEQSRPTKRGTPAETERLDLIDGIIVENVRALRRAIRSLARALGQPALAEPFELLALYGRRPKKAASDTDPGVTT